MTFLYIAFIPLYNYKASIIQAQFIAIFTWLGLCLLVSLIIDNEEDPGPALLFYVGSVFIWILTKETMD